ncbi:MAG TPA: M23 family metallopeptidase [Gemmatimonadaceae bacterium]|nr:M23 family metallopeptidase [Gemmatimonadaceae bacterium]
MSTEQKNGPARGYGNIYTPHAGSMVIQVQRESGLANRTIILSQRQVRFLKLGLYVAATTILVCGATWFFLAVQAARVPALTRQIAVLQRDVSQIDTLQTALKELDGRFHQVQQMLGVPVPPPPVQTDKQEPAITLESDALGWPLPSAGTVLAASAGTGGAPGIDVAIPQGTPVRAAGTGIVVEIRNDAQDGALVRIAHPAGYETEYGNLDSLRVAQGDSVHARTVIGLSGGPADSEPAYLHFELTHNGAEVDPTQLMKKGHSHGDLQ